MDLKDYFMLTKRVLAFQFMRNFMRHSALPYRIKIFVTYECNSHCRHCGIWKKYSHSVNEKKAELDADSWGKLFSSMNKDLLILSISGGEPFLRQDLEEVVISAASSCKNLATININTNGTLTERIPAVVENILRQIPQNTTLQISVSCDGYEETHDYLRGTRGSFRQSLESFLKLAALGKRYPNLRAVKNITIGIKNADDSKKLIDDFSAGKIPFMSSFTLDVEHFNHDKSSGLAISCLDKKDTIRLLEYIDKKTNASSAGGLLQKLYIKIAKKYYSASPKQILPCYSSWASVKIDPYGNVFPCIVWTKVMGSLKDNDFNLKKILSSENTFYIRREIKNKRCPGCWDPNDAYINIMQNSPLGVLRKIF